MTDITISKMTEVKKSRQIQTPWCDILCSVQTAPLTWVWQNGRGCMCG